MLEISQLNFVKTCHCEKICLEKVLLLNIANSKFVDQKSNTTSFILNRSIVINMYSINGRSVGI